MKVAHVAAALAAAAFALVACGNAGGGTSSGGGGAAKKIALLLPESKTARYESKDRPLFEAKVKSLCSACTIIYSNAIPILYLWMRRSLFSHRWAKHFTLLTSAISFIATSNPKIFSSMSGERLS